MVTTLHGPVLAKNPKLADRILEKLGAKVSSNTEIETLDSAIPGIWELEENLANE
jgi:CobQ-like glutamine amidotransferase family enzyme